MAALPRGVSLVLPVRTSLCRHPINTFPICRPARTFATHSPVRAAVRQPTSTVKRSVAPKTSSQPIPLHPSIANNPFLVQLARSQAPTILYEAPSHFWVKFSAWSATAFCYTAAGLNYLFFLSADEAVPLAQQWWISPVYGAACLALAGMGSFWLMRTSNIIKSIRAIPTSILDPKTLPASVNPRLTPVHLEVATKPLLLFRRKPKVVTVAPTEVVLGRRLYVPRQTPEQVRVSRKKEKAAAKAQWEEDKQRLLTLPFRDAGRGAKKVWRELKRALTGGGFVETMVAGRKCRLDTIGGWALNDGLALENLVSVEKAPTKPTPGKRK